MSIDPNQTVTFNKSIVLSYNEGVGQTQNGTIGQIRFNQSALKFEGYHSNAGALLGQVWRPLTQDIASASNLGVIKVGTNLNINPSTGVLSSIATGKSRYYALVIEVSPIPGAADYQEINIAISDAIGTLAGGYMDGALTSNLGSPPSPTWPFVIQLGPGQYSEPSNQIVLPDYVSLRGEDNYNSVITLNAGSNSNIATGSLIIAGENTEIRDLVINLADASATGYSNGIYISSKSNVVVDNCIITQNANNDTTELASCIYMTASNSAVNRITNNQIFINAQNGATTARTGIYLNDSVALVKNNKIAIEGLCDGTLTGIIADNCYISEDIQELVTLDGNAINIKNSNTAATINQCIYLANSAAIVANSQLESNSPQLTNNNWGIAFSSSTSLAEVTGANIFSFDYNSGYYTISSNNIGLANFLTAGFQDMQYVKVSGSQSNDGVYRVYHPDSSQLQLEKQYSLITEAASSNTITITALYNVQVQNSYIRGNTNAIANTDSTSGYYFSLQSNQLEGGDASIYPSTGVYSGYTILTVGKENSDYKTVNEAVVAIPSLAVIGNANKYKIFIRPGTYIETTPIVFPDNVDIEGSGQFSTIIQTSASDTTSGVIDSNCAGFLLGSNARVSNLTLINAGTDASASSTSTCIYAAPGNNTHDIILDDVNIELAGVAPYNYGVTLDTCSNVAISGLNVIGDAVSSATINCGLNIRNSYEDIRLDNIKLTLENSSSQDNLGLSLTNTSARVNNAIISVMGGSGTNLGLSALNDQSLQNITLSEFNGGSITGADNLDYSIYNDQYSTLIFNGFELIGGTYNSPISSRIVCNGCYTITNPGDASYQSLNSRGENEQSQGTITIGDTAGKQDATGTGNLLVGVNAGSNVSTDSRCTVLGSNAGAGMSGTNDNTLVGYAVGSAITTGSQNTALGSNAGANITEGGTNTLIGKDTGASLVTGSGNTMMGYQAGMSHITGNVNVLIGYQAGGSAVSGDYNVILGSNAGAGIIDGSNNTFLGNYAGFAGTNSSGSVLIGDVAGYNNQSSNVTIIGSSAAFNNTIGEKNTILGFQAAYNTTTGNCNTILGNQAGFAASGASASCNTLIGNEAGYSLTTGSRNILIGSTTAGDASDTQDAAGYAMTNGTDNTVIGNNALASATNGVNNVALGNNTGTAITTAGNNVLLGTNAGQGLTGIGNSVMIGTNAGLGNAAGNAVLVGYGAGVNNTAQHAMGIGYNSASNVSGDFNMFIGYNSGGMPKVNTTGGNNLAIGPYTGFNISSGSRNVMVGSGDVTESVGRQITTGSDNTLLGYKAGRGIQTGSNNTLIGSNAGAYLTSGVDNLILGHMAAFNLNSGSGNTVLGPDAGYSMNTASYNINVGAQSAYNQISGAYNINMGYQTGYTNNGDNNIHIGYQAGYLSTADENIFLGANAGAKNTIGRDNIFLGFNAGAGNNTQGTSGEQIGDFNTFIGYQAGNKNNGGDKNIFVGYQSGLTSEQGSKNIFIGDNTGSQGDTSHNIFIGTATNDLEGVGYQSTSTGQYNVFVGHDVGIENTTGNQNIFFGDKAGKSNTTGQQNIYIGTNAGRDANSSTADNNISIGTDASKLNQTGQENIVIGKSAAGDGTSTNFNQNIIIGTEAGQNIQQDNQIFIGTHAGQNNTTGDNNIFIGYEAGASNINSNNNVIIGADAGSTLIGTSGLGDNVIIGAQAGKDLTTGINNIFLGANAGTAAVTATNTVVIGANAMATGDASNVVIVGNLAGQNNTADGTISIGYLAGNQNTTGFDNIFVGKEAGKFTTTGDSNIIMGIQSGRDNISGANNVYVGKFAGSLNNGDSNIAMGSGALQLGTDANLNICIGQNAGRSNSSNANIFIGSGAGQSSKYFDDNISMGFNNFNNGVLSNKSIMIGSEAVRDGSGGEVNIIMGKFAGLNMGNPRFYIATLSGTSNITDNFVIVGLPYSSATYYFSYGDIIYVLVSSNSIYSYYVESFQYIDGTNTRIILNSNVDVPMVAGYIVVSGANKNASLGKGDFSKGSSNLCIGDQNGYNITTGSKNASIGDSAMYNNQVGRYNITLGTETGYNLNSDANMCIGIRAGYNIDTYLPNTEINGKDFSFYSSNNTITTSNLDFSTLVFGTVFEINNSTSNDNRYSVKYSTSNTVVVQGYPIIDEEGIPDKFTSQNLSIDCSTYYYTNFTYSGTNIIFDRLNNNRIIIETVDSNTAASIYDQILNISHIVVSNSSFNDGIKIINSYINPVGVQLSGSNVNIYTTSVCQTEPANSNITISTNNISINESVSGESFNNLFANDKLFIQFGKYRGVYTVIPTSLQQQIGYGNPALKNKGILVNENLENGSDSINSILIQGNNINPVLTNEIRTNGSAFSAFVIFDAETNTITNVPTLNLPFGGLVKVSGTVNNNGYFYINQLVQPASANYFATIDSNFQVVDETIDISILNPVTFEVVEISSATSLNQIYQSNSGFAGNIVQMHYRNEFSTNVEHNTFESGAYILENFYKNWMGLDSRLLKFNIDYDKYNIITNDTGFKMIENDYIGGNDLIYQNKTNSFSNISIDATLNVITTPVDYEFVDIISPVMIKLEGTSFNDGFYLVKQNYRPFNRLVIDGAFVSNETNISNVTIKLHSISSYLGTVNLSYVIPNNDYMTFGSKYNDNKTIKIYNDINAISNISVYIDASTTIIDDTHNDFYYLITNSNSATTFQGYYHYGQYKHFINNDVTISVVNTTTIEIDVSSNVSLSNDLDILKNESYLKFSNTPSNSYDGLYKITNISNASTIYTIIFDTSYIRNNIVYTTPDPFSPLPGSNITANLLCNQFVLASYNTFDFGKLINGFGENCKFLSFAPNYVGYLFGNNLMDNQFTFEIESFPLNTSNTAVHFVETCPNNSEPDPLDPLDTFIINFGEPNPTNRSSDIKRKRRRNITYSYSSFLLRVSMNFYSSNNSVNITTSPYTNFNYTNNVHYGQIYGKDDFSMLFPGDYVLFDTPFNNNNYLISSISADKQTLYFDSTGSNPTVTDESAINVNISLRESLLDSNLNWGLYNSGAGFGSDDKISITKNPSSFGSVDNISIINFEINSINYGSNSACSLTPGTLGPSATTTLAELGMNHVILTPTKNVLTNYTNISFHNLTANGSNDISFYASNNTITSTITDLSGFLKHEYIMITSTTNNNGLVRISDTITPTTNAIVIDTEFNLQNENATNAILYANNINSSNIVITDLISFGYGVEFISSKTTFNNGNFKSYYSVMSSYSLFIDSSTVISEIPLYCVLEKSMLIDETSTVVGIADINFNNLVNPTITVSDMAVDLSVFRENQKISISGTTSNDTNEVIIDAVPTQNLITLSSSDTLVNEFNTNATLTKRIKMFIVGAPIQSEISSTNTILYHYEDAQGNNAMIGAFAGQFVGALNTAIYNMMIGSRCGQVNHGSGNIFIGNESQLATEATQGATTYSNKFAIYKNNQIGVPSNPMFGGDFGSGRVGINTITPESYNTVSDITVTDTKLVVNGGAIANSFTPFTGCHIVYLDPENNTSNVVIQPGMIMSSVGKVQKQMIINTFVTVRPSHILNDKAVFGVYAYKEQSKKSSESEYIINSDGKYVRNSSYTNEMITLNYVAALGEGCILVSNFTGKIHNGDYITSSPITGYGTLQADDILHSYTVAKCTEDIDWDTIAPNLEYQGTMYKSILAACTYHCG